MPSIRRSTFHVPNSLIRGRRTTRAVQRSSRKNNILALSIIAPFWALKGPLSGIRSNSFSARGLCVVTRDAGIFDVDHGR